MKVIWSWQPEQAMSSWASIWTKQWSCPRLDTSGCSCDVTVTRWSCINIGYVFCWWRPAKPRWRYCSSFVWSRSPNVHLFQKYRLTFLNRSCVPSKSTLVQAILTTTTGWRHQTETFLRHWPFVQGIHWPPVNSPHKGQWRRAFIFFCGLGRNTWLSNQSRGWWFKTPSCSLCRHRNGYNCLSKI